MDAFLSALQTLISYERIEIFMLSPSVSGLTFGEREQSGATIELTIGKMNKRFSISSRKTITRDRLKY